MLVFGPYSVYRTLLNKGNEFIVFNLSSQNQDIKRLPGLLVELPFMIISPEQEKEFDRWYYEYLIEDPVACSSLISILMALYDGHDVYICISEYSSNNYINIINETFMKIIQTRYNIKYYLINDELDLKYTKSDGCIFQDVNGIYNFDSDRRRFMQIAEENRIMNGGSFEVEN